MNPREEEQLRAISEQAGLILDTLKSNAEAGIAAIDQIHTSWDEIYGSQQKLQAQETPEFKAMYERATGQVYIRRREIMREQHVDQETATRILMDETREELFGLFDP